MSKNSDKFVIKTDKRSYYAEDKIQTNVHCMVRIIQAAMAGVLREYCNCTSIEFKVDVDKALRDEFMATMAKYSNVIIPVSDQSTPPREYLTELLREASKAVLKEYLESGWFDADSEQKTDAVPVVRCKDCKHYDEGVCWKYKGIYDAVFDMDFCSRGERKEDKQ